MAKPSALPTPMGNPPAGIEAWDIARLKPYANNSRTHSPEQIDQLVESIEEFGFTIPILVDEKGMVLAGHGRLEAAKKRGMTHVPVLVTRGWSADRKRAYIIADNRLALNAGWDNKILGSELGALALSGFDMGVLGFAPGEVAALIALGTKANAEPDDAPPAPKVPVSQLGDLWVLGAHRVLCGDATSRAAVARLLEDRKPKLMVTDPPYGVNYDPAWRTAALKDGANRAEGKVSNDERVDWSAAWALFTGDVAYVWHDGRHGGEVEASLKAAKFNVRAQIVWVKTQFALGRGNFHWQHEPAFYVQKEGAVEDHWRFDEEHEVAAYVVKIGEIADWRGGRKQSTVWNIDMVKNNTGHATQKPVECMARPIRNNSGGGGFCLRPLPRIRHNRHRGGRRGPDLPWPRARPRLCGRDSRTLGHLYRWRAGAGGSRLDVRGNKGPSPWQESHRWTSRRRCWRCSQSQRKPTSRRYCSRCRQTRHSRISKGR